MQFKKERHKKFVFIQSKNSLEMRGATIIAAAILLCTLVSVCVARYSQSLVGKPCNTNTPCGDRVELSTVTTKCTKCKG